MIKTIIVDVDKIYREFHPCELGTRECFICYSIIEHEIFDLGFDIEVYTQDVRKMPFINASNGLKEGLKEIVQSTFMCLPADKEVYLSIYKTAKHILITVK